MINGRFASYLFAVTLVVSISPMSMFGKDSDSADLDFVELLEMQLIDIKQENSRLVSKLDEMEEQTQSKSGYKKDIKNLKKENSLLKAEIIKLDKNIATDGKSIAEMEQDLEELRKQKKSKRSKSDNKVAKEVNAELKARCANLEDENANLKQELGSHKKRALKAESEHAQVKSDLDHIVAISKDSAKGGLVVKVSRLESMLAATEAKLLETKRNSIDEDRALKLKSKMQKMKAVEEQRKEALDDLFKQLAGVKGALKEKDAKVELMIAEDIASRGLLTSKASEIDRLEKKIREMQGVVDSHSGSQQALKELLEKEKRTVASKAEDMRREVAVRQSIEAELSQIKLTDEQRKKAMDNLLTNLATSDNLNSETAIEIKRLENKLTKLISESKSEIASLKKNAAMLDREIVSMEKELKIATDSKQSLESEIRANSTAAQHDKSRVVELETELVKANTTDAQRKKRMDKLLLEIAALEELQAGNKRDVDSDRKEFEQSKSDILRVRNEFVASQNSLATARKEIKNLRSKNPNVVNVDVSDQSVELEALQQANEKLQQKIVALEGFSGSATTEGDKSASSNAELNELMELEKAQWIQVKSDLDSKVAHLQKVGSDQAASLKTLKSDLAESEKVEKQLSKEVKKLENRKIDVRNSDLFQEMEGVNVKLREKIVQIESERQRLAKSEKKLLKRDERFDDDIDHEVNLRKKAEKDISEARAREFEYQELIERLMAEVPQLEAQITELSEKAAETRVKLLDREEDLLAIKSELEKREHRLIKAERVAEVLESAREDVLHSSDKEKLDMHYNMAAVYAREGKYEAAEQEYLRALRLNPTDADVHYNLGILYDDELKSSTKAVVHYRRYLKLNPHGPDADQVRNWLMKLEMKKKQ